MAILVNDIRVPVQVGTKELPHYIADVLAIPRESVQSVRLVRQSLDARRKNDIHFRVSVVVQIDAPLQARLLKKHPNTSAYTPPEAYELQQGNEAPCGRVVVVGLGPAGLFAAYFLAKAGYRPLCVERGKNIERRSEDVEKFRATGQLNPQSNVTFGEGGAGTFSDGKLTSRSKNERADVVLQTFYRHGAPEDILYHAKPHIGTDVLRQVIQNMREEIEKMGGEVRFDTQLVDFTLHNGAIKNVHIESNDSIEKVACSACVLATGQAARDTYELLEARSIPLEAKAFAVGLRVEHPQGLIDRAQFGEMAGDARLGAAEYRLRAQGGTRGVYTFCMCPGGEVIAAASGAEQVVVNGMSNRARDGANANAAIIVQVGPNDFGHNALDGVRFQADLERRAYIAGGRNFFAPAQRMEDFLKGTKSKHFSGDVTPTYRPGVISCQLEQILPGYVTAALREGMQAFSGQLRGFALPDAVLTAVESRTSAPVRVLRNESGQSPGAVGLYPTGEGAGYAGGIVSAAIDGMMAAEKIAARFAPDKQA